MGQGGGERQGQAAAGGVRIHRPHDDPLALAPVPSPLLASLALAPRFEGRSSAEAARLTPSNEPAARESLFTKEETNSINGENPKTGGRMRWLLRRKKDAGS